MFSLFFIQRKLFSIQEAGAFAFAMPSLPGVGVTGEFTFMLQDREGIGLDQLQAVSGEVISTPNHPITLHPLNSSTARGDRAGGMRFRCRLP